MAYKEISAEEFAYSPFKTIGKDWLLVTAQKDGRANAMTASWGGLGVMWGKNVAFIVIRPQRYTKEFIDGAEGFSLSVFGEERRKMMSYSGSVSGRDEDKLAKADLTPLQDAGRMYFAEAKITLRRNSTRRASLTRKAMRSGMPMAIIIRCTSRRSTGFSFRNRHCGN